MNDDTAPGSLPPTPPTGPGFAPPAAPSPGPSFLPPVGPTDSWGPAGQAPIQPPPGPPPGSPPPADPDGGSSAQDGSGTGDDGARPIPSLAAIVAVGGGLLAALGLVSILSELDGFDQRVAGFAISLLFTALGVALSVINRSKRSAAAGVALSALAVIPLVGFTFINGNVFERFFDDDGTGDLFDGVIGMNTWILLALATLWMIGYLVGPGRRYGFYLGASLIALWLIPMNYFTISAIDDTVNSFFANPFGLVEPGPTFDSDSTFGFDTELPDDFDQIDPDDFGQIDPDDLDSQLPTFDPFADVEPPPDPTTKLGVTSLLFGAAYLGFAARRDRDGDARMATAVLVPAYLVLGASYVFLSSHLGTFGSPLYLLAIAAAGIAVGLRGGRRLSCWLGIGIAAFAVAELVGAMIKTSAAGAGIALTILGLVLALGAGWWESRTPAVPGSDTPIDPAVPPVPGDPSDEAAPLAPVAPFGMPPSPAAPLPTAGTSPTTGTPPTDGPPPATPPGWGPTPPG